MQAGNISQCHCLEIALSLEEKIYIEEKFADCLCNHCLLQIKQEYKLSLDKFVFDR